MSIPREQPNQNKDMKIAYSVLLSLYMRDNEMCNIKVICFLCYKTKVHSTISIPKPV